MYLYVYFPKAAALIQSHVTLKGYNLSALFPIENAELLIDIHIFVNLNYLT